jgi:hypothetical protein
MGGDASKHLAPSCSLMSAAFIHTPAKPGASPGHTRAHLRTPPPHPTHLQAGQDQGEQKPPHSRMRRLQNPGPRGRRGFPRDSQQASFFLGWRGSQKSHLHKLRRLPLTSALQVFCCCPCPTQATQLSRQLSLSSEQQSSQGVQSGESSEYPGAKANSAPTSTHSPGLCSCPNILTTPLGGPGEEAGVEHPIGHVVRGEDDDIALGVPIAEHTSMIVGPEERQIQKMLWSLLIPSPQTAPSMLGVRVVPTSFQVMPWTSTQLTNMDRGSTFASLLNRNSVFHLN